MALTNVESRPSPGIEAVPDAPGSAHAATERVLRIVVLVWSAAWIVLMASEGADTSLAPALTWAMLAGLAVGWVVVVLARLPVGTAYVAALAGTALVQALLTPPLGLWSESGLLLTWTNLAAISCGFVVAGARGRIAVAAIAAGQLLILTTRAWADGTVAVAWPGVVAAAAYALADGMAAHVAASAVRGQARETDAAAERLAVERARRAVREARVREAERISRVLHDTVLNTLGALRRGIDPAETGALRARCAHDLDELRHLRDTRFETTGDTGVGAEALVHALTARASVLSLELDVRSRITATTTLPTPVADAVAGACAEALVNVAKHSGTRAAVLSLTWDGAVLEVGVHDEGCGWSGELLPEHGVSRSILGRAIEAGLDPLVATAPDRGTTVSLTWQAPVALEEPAERRGRRRRPGRGPRARDRRRPRRQLAGRAAGLPLAGLLAEHRLGRHPRRARDRRSRAGADLAHRRTRWPGADPVGVRRAARGRHLPRHRRCRRATPRRARSSARAGGGSTARWSCCSRSCCSPAAGGGPRPGRSRWCSARSRSTPGPLRSRTTASGCPR